MRQYFIDNLQVLLCNKSNMIVFLAADEILLNLSDVIKDKIISKTRKIFMTLFTL